MSKANEVSEKSTVFVVDPDPATGKTVRGLLNGSDLNCEVYETGREFLAAYREARPGCVVLEQAISDMSGLQILRRLTAGGMQIPFVFLVANPDFSTAIELMRRGALHVLEKPPRAIALLNAIHEALEVDQGRRRSEHNHSQFVRLAELLTKKERQVFELLAQGKSPKQVAAELERTVRAVEMRRKSLMKKLNVTSTIELMRFWIINNRGN